MRKLLIAASLSLALLMLLPLIASAGGHRAGVPRVYEGETSQGKRLRFDFVKHADGTLSLKEFEFRTLVLTCSIDATTQRWGIGYFLGGRGFDLEGRMLDFEDHDPFESLTIQGRVKATTIDGTLIRFSTAQLTEDEEPQLCTTGNLTWSADRTVPVPATSRIGRSTEVGTRIVHRLDDGGRLTLTRLS
jgi:hypothetical protein